MSGLDAPRSADDAEAPRLGAFVLEACVSSGGMGQVWRGRHVGDGVPVAVKFVRADARDLGRVEDALRREVRAAAALYHPSIVAVLDHGVVDTETALRSGGRLSAGSPYFVMEWFPDGALRPTSVRAWEGLSELLRTLLEALAHAHARGVIHRDLKPANVLVSGARPSYLLTDFGIAQVLADEDPTGAHLGTAHYMAPEQLRGAWWEHGPWTDLYALGCVAFEVAAGHRPHDGTDAEVARKHLAFPMPPLRPRFEVPSGFEAWMRAMMARSPSQRFSRAADALRGLDALERPSARTSGHAPAVETLDADSIRTATRTAAVTPVDDTHETPPSATTSSVEASPAFVDEALWDAPRPWRIRDAGLRLFSLRRVPLVGRAHEREALRAALRDVARHRRAACVVLRGPAGVGKHRLAQWLLETAHERGAADTLALRGAPDDDARDALSELVGRHFHAHDVSRAEASRRIRALLARATDAPDDLVDALTNVALGEGSPALRARTVARWFEATARTRPLVVLVDAAALARTPRELFEAVLGGATAVLFVVTTRDETCAPLDDFSPERVTTIELGPLSLVHQAEVIQRTIPVEPTLAARLAARTAGRCALALRLLEDCIARGVLIAGPSGYTLATGASQPTPDGVFERWDERLAIVLSHRGEGPGLGADAAHTESAAAWILQGARERYRLGEWPIVDELVSLHDEALTAMGVPQRDARRAEAWELRARTYVWQGRRDDARRWTEATLDAARASGRPDLEARTLHHLAKIAYDDNDCARAAELFRRTLTLAEAAGDLVGVARAHLAASCVALRLARTALARTEAERARALGVEAGELTLAAVCTMQLGIVARMRREFSRAQALLTDSLAGCAETGYALGVAQAEHELGVLALRRNDASAALDHAERAVAHYRSVGAHTEALEARCVRVAARHRLGDPSPHEVDAVRALAADVGAQGPRGMVLAVELCAAAQRRTWSWWDRCVEELEAWRAGADQVDAAMPVVRDAIRGARAAGERARAERLDEWAEVFRPPGRRSRSR